jgi:regulator of protease activity HflC (stomatin/prohibitin superfamily)
MKTQTKEELYPQARKGLQILTAGLVAATLILGSWTIVPEGSRGVVTRTGAVIGTVNQGLNFKIPFIDTVNPISIMADAVEIKGAEGATKDSQPVHTTLVVRYHNDEAKVASIYSNFSKTGDMDSYVATAAMEAFKASTAAYSADELVVKRQDASTRMLNTLQSKVDQFGVKIQSIDVAQFAFSPEYMKAINAKVTEEQLKLAEENKLERIKVEQQQKVVAAKAEAEAVIATSKAKAEAVRLEAQALRENQNILELRRVEVEKIKAETWNGVLPTTVLGGAIPMINIGK